MASKCSKADEKVQVTVRCRPINQSERLSRVKKVIECNNKAREVNVVTSTTALGLTASQQTKVYNFDRVFGPVSTQLDVYKNVVESQLQDVLAGYNCTVLAYGQTGTGKTYTMEGERTIGEDYMWDTDPRAGIIPRALSQLFDCLEKTGSEFSVRVSLLEIYNEEIYDLLSHSTDMLKMKIYEDHSRKGSVVVSGLTEVHVRDKSDVYDILQQGAAKRRTAATNLNEFSSRSHSVFSVTVHTKDITHCNMEEEELVKIGKLNLVDLAGSENIGRSGAVDKRAREAGSINQSLLTLGRCITALVDRAPHVPYRESKLTRLLQDSLGGATKTSIIATISPGSDNLEETLSTLDYAARAKNIHNKPKINQKLTKRALIKEYDDEIEKLRREVVALREKNGVYVDPKTYSEMVSRIESLTATVKQREEDVEKFQQLFTDTSAQLTERTERLHILHDDLTQTRKELAEQCCLKDAYMEHAADAVNHASELLKTADLVTSDIDKVHDKVDRVKQVHQNNLNTVRSFSGKLKDDVSLLCQGTAGALEQNQTSLQKTMDGLCLMKEEHGNSLDAMAACVTQLHHSMNDTFKQTAETLTKISANAQSRNTEHDDALSEMKNDMEVAINNWEEKGKTLGNVVKSLVELVDLIKAATHSQCGQLESYVATTRRYEEEVAGYVSEINATNAQLRDKQKRMMEEMQANMKKMSESMLTAFDEGHNVTIDKGQSIKQCAEALSKETCQSVAIQMSGVKQTEEQVTQVILKDCVDPIESHIEETAADAKNLWHNVSMHSVAISTIMNLMTADEETETEKGNEQLSAASETVFTFQSQCHDDISNLGKTLKEHIDDANDVISSINSKISATETDIEEAETSILQAVDDCFQERFETIVPIGITPARKPYEYPSRVPRAPLQEEVLANFRERILDEESQEEDEPTEEDEDDNEEDKPCRSDSGVSATSAVDVNLDQSITIPDVGGIPFFKKARKAKVHPRKNGKPQGSRIPFRPVQNLD